MKRRLIIQICCLAVILLFSVANAAQPSSESRRENASEAQCQVKMDIPGRAADYDQDREANKRERFQLLEWLIIQKLQKQYQQMEGLEDVLDLIASNRGLWPALKYTGYVNSITGEQWQFREARA